MFQTKFVEKIKKKLDSIRFFPFENRAVCDIMCKNIVTAGHATDDNMADAHCVLDT
jgi:hypothetical protein